MSNEVDKVYQSFLVRCWLITPATADELSVWRFELRTVADEPQIQRFNSLEQMQDFVAEELAAFL